MDSTLLVPLEMEPFPALVRTSAPNTGLFPKLTAFTFLTHKKKQRNFLCTCQGDTWAEKCMKKRDGGWWVVAMVIKTSCETHSMCFLAAGGPSRACDEEFMGIGRKLIETNPVESVFVYAWSIFEGGKTWDYSFSILGKSFTVCCHPFEVEHLSDSLIYVWESSICISNMWSDHETDALWPWTNWYSKVIKPRPLFKLWPFDHLTITGW